MQGTISQIVALTIWGNAALQNKVEFRSNSFYPANSTFVFCEYVNFVELKKKGKGWEEVLYAPDPIAWLESLKADGVHSLRMLYQASGADKKLGVPARMLVGFVGGGGRWLIEALKPNGSEYWAARWEVGDRNHPDQKIWRVTYGCCVPENQSPRPASEADAEAIRQQLMTTLPAIAEFARRHDEKRFAEIFEAALARLTSPRPLEGLYHSDIAPPNVLPLIAEQLLGTAQAAWVFGGMGSWNDLGFMGEDQNQYEALSEKLYRLLNAAIVAAANSS